MATVAKSLGGLMWVINPCKVIYERKNARLRFLAPPISDEDNANSSNWMKLFDLVHILKHGGNDQEGLWAGNAPGTAPRWAQFSPGKRHTGKQAAVAYATKEGHLFQASFFRCGMMYRREAKSLVIDAVFLAGGHFLYQWGALIL